jgi:hypothetical protein
MPWPYLQNLQAQASGTEIALYSHGTLIQG